MCKFITLGDLQQVVQIIGFIKEIYVKNDDEMSRYYKTCRQFGRISKNILKIGFSFYTANAIFLAQVTTIEYFRTGELKPCFNAYFPGIYDYSGVTKLLLLLYNYGIAALAVFSATPGDFLFFITFVHIPMISTIIRGQLDELDDILVDHQTTEWEIKIRLIQYLSMHRKLNA